MLIARGLVRAIVWAVGFATVVEWYSFLTTCQPYRHNQSYNPYHEYCSGLSMTIFDAIDHGLIWIGDLMEKPPEAITAIATVFLAIITWRLVVLGREQGATTRAQLRAYVFVSEAKIHNMVAGEGDGEIPVAQFTIKNTGQTPAYNLVNVSGFAIAEFPITSIPNMVITDSHFPPELSRTPLGPGDHQISRVHGKYGMTLQHKALLASGKNIAFAYGEIRYVDAFKRPQVTRYRFMIGGPVGVSQHGAMAVCGEGNEAT